MKSLVSLKVTEETTESTSGARLTVPRKDGHSAFTLIELLVVIAIIAILAAVLLPVLHQAQIRGQTATCINDQKQLATAWLMYASDNNDACAGNNWPDEENWTMFRGPFSPTASVNGPQNWISGWMDPSGTSPSSASGLPNGDSDNTNDDILVDSSYASLGDYVKNRKLFICPACIVRVDSYSGGPDSYSQIRSISMNCWVGYNCLPPGAVNTAYAAGTAPTPDYSALNYKTFSRVTDMKAGADPADIFVFMEERGESIDDGSFETSEASPGFPNMPTDYHNGAATVGYGDGHVDVHRWHDGGLLTPQQEIVQTKLTGAGLNAGRGDPDWNWLAQHASVHK